MCNKNIENLVSIITPSYNSEDFISFTIKSVLDQTYQNWEMIIIDDCSTDNSTEIIQGYIQKDSRIKLIYTKKNSGPSAARNLAIEISKGRYIAFLDADDIWLPHKLKTQIQFMNDNNLSFTYSSYYLIDEKGKDLGVFNTKSNISYAGMLRTCSVGCLTAIYDTQKIGKLYMEGVFGHEDYTLWLKILKKVDYAYGIQEPLAKYRILNNSLSRDKIQAAKYQWQVYRKIEKLSLAKSLYYFVQYAYHGVKKYN
ncbi:MAG: glycosyltransferase family 2 protein [Gammaproteobacteria bacterium]|nr:MAG: glycosyltransferase family 2 protein [Gammaproteobacteria bacterium]